MHPGWKGGLLGAANVIFVAIGYGISDDSSLTALLGMMLAVLVGLAVSAVFLLGFAFGFMNNGVERQMVVVACIPTAVAALLLERWTRRVVDPPIPPAQAR